MKRNVSKRDAAIAEQCAREMIGRRGSGYNDDDDDGAFNSDDVSWAGQ